MSKWVYTFGDGKAEGDASMRNLLGGKGANLAEMNKVGLPDSYLRYLTNNLRDTFNMGGIPLRINVRKTGNPYADKE